MSGVWLNVKAFVGVKANEKQFPVIIMKTSLFDFGLLALVVACLLNIAINTGCVTKPANGQSSFKVEGLERAAGPQSDDPINY